jgi:hypothetical protein
VIEPHIGDIVHFATYGTTHGEWPPTCTAAIITATWPHDPAEGAHTVSLRVFRIDGDSVRQHVTHDDGDEDPDAPPLYCRGRDYPGGTWHWGP